METFKKILNGILVIIIWILKWIFTFVKDIVVDAWENKDEIIEKYEENLADTVKKQDTTSLNKRAEKFDSEENLTKRQEMVRDTIEDELSSR